MGMKHSPNSGMHHISDLFSVYRTRLKPPQKTVEKAAVVVIERISGIVVEDTNVVFTPHSRVLALHIPSVIKNEILLFQGVILETLRLELGSDRAPTILL